LVHEGKIGFHGSTRQSGEKQVGSRGRNPTPPARSPIQCPECDSNKIWRDGLRYLNNGENIQRYLCRSCGFRFSKPNVKVHVSPKLGEALYPRSKLLDAGVVVGDLPLQKSSDDLAFPFREDVGSHELTSVGKGLNTFSSYNSKRRVCVAEAEGTKNLAEQETRIEKWAAGATTQKLVDFGMWMLKQGYSENTITLRVKLLKILMRRGADLYEPETVKETIAKQSWCNGRKVNAVNAYSTFLGMTGGHWDPPHYEQSQKIVFIPTEQEVDQLIAGCGRKTATVLQTLKETAARIGEVAKMKWADVDTEQQIIRVNAPEKGSLPRAPKISTKLLSMILSLPRKNEYVFGNVIAESWRNNFTSQRKKIATKLQNPRMNLIHFHTLRHWKLTMIAHQTKDPFYVQQFAGHKDIRNTMRYIHLAQLIYKENNDEFTCKTAKNIEEAKQLIEVGFEFIHEFNGLMLFKKRK